MVENRIIQNVMRQYHTHQKTKLFVITITNKNAGKSLITYAYAPEQRLFLSRVPLSHFVPKVIKSFFKKLCLGSNQISCK